jgi:hypothetical protein
MSLASHRQTVPALLLSMLLGSLLLAACGGPFFKGWRDGEKDERSDEEKCEAAPNWSWRDGACKKDDEGLSLDDVDSKEECEKVADAGWMEDADRCVRYRDFSETQCAALAGWDWAQDECRPEAEATCLADEGAAWVEGQCVTRPVLRVEGSLNQTVAPGQAIKPLDLKPSAGASVELRDGGSCEGYFKIVNQTLGSGDGLDFATDSEARVCKATLVAVAGGVESLPVKVTVTLARGFVSWCKDEEAPQAVRDTVYAIIRAVEKSDCDETAKALADTANMHLEGVGVRDLRPFVGLAKLLRLDLPDNDVTDVTPLASLPALKFLDLSHNRVETVAPLAKSKTLSILKMTGTPLATGAVVKTEANCPTKDGVNPAVRAFCVDR